MDLNNKLTQLLKNVGDMSLKRRARVIIEAMALKKGDSVIDIGCGDGFLLYLLSNLPIKLNLIGFDKNKIVLKNAKDNLNSKNIRLIEGDIINTENLSFICSPN